MKHLDLSQLKLSSISKALPGDIIAENNILKIQDLILSSGINYIKVKNIFIGRELLKTFFTSLQIYYNSIAFISLFPAVINLPIIDLIQEESFQDIIKNKSNAIENFLFESFNCDLLIIEQTKELLAKPWYTKFIKTLEKFKLSENISVLILTYE